MPSRDKEIQSEHNGNRFGLALLEIFLLGLCRAILSFGLLLGLLFSYHHVFIQIPTNCYVPHSVKDTREVMIN